MVGKFGSNPLASLSVAGWFRQGTILRQLGKSFNLFALTAIIVGAVATAGVMRIQDRSERLAQLTDIAFLTSSMERSVGLAKNEMGAFRARGFAEDRIANSISLANSSLAMNDELLAAATAVDPGLVDAIGEIDSGLNGVVAILLEVRDAERSLLSDEAYLGPRYDAIDQVILKIVAVREVAAAKVADQSSQGLSDIKVLIGLLCIGVVILLAVIYALRRTVAQRIVLPITTISDVSTRIAEGETQLAIPETDRTDEIGNLANALTVLRRVQAEASEQAIRDLERERQLQQEREEQRREYSEKLIALADQFESSIGDVANKVAHSSIEMKHAATTLATKVEDSSAAVLAANSNLKDASSGITSAAAATDEFALSINEVSRQAASSSERARKACESVSRADATISDLNSSADKISQIVEVIANIAQRTNLLALNASIEAARSAEHGRGFAVVASEVKDLATQTAGATSEVENLIKAMQLATDQSTRVLSSISEEVRELETAAMSIASAVDQQSVAAHELSKSIDLAAGNTNAVSATIDDVSEVSQTSGSIAAQVQEGSAHLSEQSQVLRKQVDEFLATVRAA